MLKEEYRLKKRKDFAFIYRRGKSFVAKRVAINYVKSRNKNELLIGFSVSKKIGNAVKRNHVKRMMREIVRLNFDTIPKGYRLTFNARVAISTASYEEIQKDLFYLISRLKQKQKKHLKNHEETFYHNNQVLSTRHISSSSSTVQVLSNMFKIRIRCNRKTWST